MTSSTPRGPWRFEGTWRCIGQCCWGPGGRATNNALAGSGIRGDAVVRRAVLSGERWPCNGRDMVEAVGERRWCNGPRRGRGLQCLGTMQRCYGRCCWGRGGSATDDRGGCSGVFVFYLHMGMGEIHWREEVDFTVIRIKDRDIFLRKRYYFVPFFVIVFF